MEIANELTRKILNEALPGGFPFYNLGEVTTDPAAAPVLQELQQPGALDHFVAIGFRLITDSNTWIVTLFDQQLDRDVYSELGNILASQFATRLQDLEALNAGDEPLLISPPMKLSLSLLTQWIEKQPSLITRTYWHQLNGQAIAIHVLVLSGEQGGTA
jgi:hypothetical protein